MKKFRKIMAVLVAAMMIVAMAVPAWAASNEDSGRIENAADKGTITIEKAQDGETYKVYKIFDLLSFYDSDRTNGVHTNEQYSYGLDTTSNWLNFFDPDYSTTESPWGTDYITIDKTLPITIGTKTYYPLKLKDGSSLADEIGRDNSISGVASGTQSFARAAKKFIDTVNSDANQANDIPVAASMDSSTGTSATNATVVDGKDDDNQCISISFSNLALGYYLVDSSVGTLCALDTTNKIATIIDKNDIPTITKKVLDKQYSSDVRVDGVYTTPAHFVDNTSYNIGDRVKFTVEINVPKYAKNYVLHDVMEDGFKLDASTIEVFYTNQAASGNAMLPATENTHYTLATGDQKGNNADFTITFNNTALLDILLKDDSKIQVDYIAELTQDAEVYGDAANIIAGKSAISPIEGNPAKITTVAQVDSRRDGDQTNNNYAILSYGDGSSTAWAETTVDTYQFDVIKTLEANPVNEYPLLAGAEFEVYTEAAADATPDSNDIPQLGDNKSSPLSFVTATTGTATNQANADHYALPDKAQKDNASTTKYTYVTTTTGKKLNFRGLVPGTYYVREKFAPNGYDAIPGLIKVIINGKPADPSNDPEEGSISVLKPTSPMAANASTGAWQGTINASTKWTEGGVDVLNKTSNELPSTGGMGTTVLYIVGGMLVILAGAYLFFSRKRTA